MSKYKRYSEADYHKIIETYIDCGGINETARMTQFPRTTVQRIIERYKIMKDHNQEIIFSSKREILPLLKRHTQDYQRMRFHYAYILGMYFGDGHIAEGPRSYRMMIYLDIKYPGIIRRCTESLENILPDNQVSVIERHGQNCVYVSCVSIQMPDIFPQHGAGKKHERDIILDKWQKDIVDQFPLEFFRGLYHSEAV